MLTPKEQIQKAFNEGHLSGSWMIVGPYGVGKKRLAEEISALVLTGSFEGKITNASEVKWIERGFTEEVKRRIQKKILAGKSVDEEEDTTSRRQEITVDDIRAGLRFLSLTTTEKQTRILIIHLADEMNENAQNALLKALEEPRGKNLILLLCQNVGRILPTIRSRCRQIMLRPLSQTALAQLFSDRTEEAALLADLAGGSVGLAEDILAIDGLQLYHRLDALLMPIADMPISDVRSYVSDICDNKEVDLFRFFKLFVLMWLEKRIKDVSLTSQEHECWLDLYGELSSLMNETERLYLDKKQVAQTALFKIAEVLK